MNKTESIKSLAEGLILFHSKVQPIPKNGVNPFFKSKYALLGDILKAIKNPLKEADLTIAQFPEGEHGLTTILIHTSGEYISSTYKLTPSKNDPQGAGSALTYQRRYALVSILGLDTDEDDDGAVASSNKIEHGEDNKNFKI